MIVQGYCDGCRKFKRVRVSAHQLAIASATQSKLLRGTCTTCEEKK